MTSFFDLPLSRRAAIKLLGAGAATLYLRPAWCASSEAGGRPDAHGPIARGLDHVAPRRFSGDDPARPHRILWDRQAYLAGRAVPPPDKSVPVVIVGGGIAGLCAAYRLRAHGPMVLEQAARFGGNSQGEAWRGIDYSIGAAYFTAPAQGSPLHALYRELGVDRMWREKAPGHPVEVHGRIERDLWSGDSAPRWRAQFRALRRYFHDVVEEKRGLAYPEIPPISAAGRRDVNRLDGISFRRHVESLLRGQPLHPYLATAFEHYCWSSFGASFEEVSAAAGLNFFAAEFGGILVTPGGNAAVAQRLYDRLRAVLPADHLQASALALRVRSVPDGVEVTYEDGAGALRRVQARAAVLACPKFVVARILDELEPQRLAAIQRLRYRAYLVANVLLRRPLPASLYDLYLLGAGREERDIAAAAARQGATDVVFGTYAAPNPAVSALTLYRALPYDTGRAALYADGAYARYRREFEDQLRRSILPLLGLREEDVADLRVARWGHALPVAATGLIAQGTIDRLREPFHERVFFAQQDNWALPALETAALEALHWAGQAERVLRP